MTHREPAGENVNQFVNQLSVNEFTLAGMNAAIILDKCFLQGTSAARIRELATIHRLVVSDALFYELLTSTEPGRSRCFNKFPPVVNPVDLVSHIGPLMRLEIETHKPSGCPSSHREDWRFQFNPALVTPQYKVPDAGRLAIEEHLEELRSDVASSIERARLTPTFFPDVLAGNQIARDQARADAEAAIAEPGSLLKFYSSLEPPNGEKPLPPAHLVSEKWAVYRWLQVQMLFGLDLHIRYGGRIPEPLSTNIFEKIEHDVLDAQVLMLGCLEGAFATRERKLQRWYKLLCPGGMLYE
jgi:hypothetical protein